jgi:DNA-binding IclR family transcriptional regulator
MQELADRLNSSVALAIGDHLDMLYIGYRVGHRVATLRLGVGSLLPMGTTSIGRAWLWGLPLPQQKALIAALRREAGSQGAAMERGIREGFAELEATGVCSVLGGFQRDAYGIALPVHVGVQRVPMSLSCGAADLVPDLAAERKRITPGLRKAAVELEKLLADLDGTP